MSIYEASLKTTDPITGSTTLTRVLTMRAPSASHVATHAKALGLTKTDESGELIVYRF